MLLESWNYYCGALFDMLSMDFSYLKERIPILDEALALLMAVGWALLIGNLIFQALKTMATGLGFEGEDPKLLFLRTFVFSFLLLACPQICEIGLSITQQVITLLDIPAVSEIALPDHSMFLGLYSSWALMIICSVIVMFKIFRMIFDLVERYIILSVLTLFAPLAFGMGGSRNTSDIFSGWCRMFGSMCLTIVTYMLFFKLLISMVSHMPTGVEILPWLILIFGITKTARRIDSLITRIGLNPMIVGDGLGSRGIPGALAVTVVRAMAQQVTKAAGKSAGSSHKSARHHASRNRPAGNHTAGANSTAHYSSQSRNQERTSNTLIHSSGNTQPNSTASSNTSVQQNIMQSTHEQSAQHLPQVTQLQTDVNTSQAGNAFPVSSTKGNNRGDARKDNSTRFTSVSHGARTQSSNVNRNAVGIAGNSYPAVPDRTTPHSAARYGDTNGGDAAVIGRRIDSTVSKGQSTPIISAKAHPDFSQTRSTSRHAEQKNENSAERAHISSANSIEHTARESAISQSRDQRMPKSSDQGPSYRERVIPQQSYAGAERRSHSQRTTAHTAPQVPQTPKRTASRDSASFYGNRTESTLYELRNTGSTQERNSHRDGIRHTAVSHNEKHTHTDMRTTREHAEITRTEAASPHVAVPNPAAKHLQPTAKVPRSAQAHQSISGSTPTKRKKGRPKPQSNNANVRNGGRKDD